MTDLDLRSTFPEWLSFTGEDMKLRRKREVTTPFRRWEILPRYGSAESDRWTIIGTPAPGPSNPARDYEDGQYPSLAAAYDALNQCLTHDDGTHEK